MKRRLCAVLGACLVLAFVWSLSASVPQVATAQRPLPVERAARGLVYGGLVPGTTSICRDALQVVVPGKAGKERTYCTHGPDPAPAGVNVKNRVSPQSNGGTTAKTTIMCDGDGVSGQRVQVIYAHASDVPDRYDAYLASFRQWVAGVDAIFNDSAAETGGMRHVRFVHDSSCVPVIADVTLSPAGDDYFGSMVGELAAQGFNRTDRKYLVFMDASVYCGIAQIRNDDQPGPVNANNGGPNFARVDSACWSDILAAHELMHNLGGVQLSAPHTTGGWHCFDVNDRMCYQDAPTAPTMQRLCRDRDLDRLFDCNNDDYFNTNPVLNTYLSTHWNAANNLFLMQSKTAHIGSLATGTLTQKVFAPADSFSQGDKVTVQARVVDENGWGIKNANVNLSLVKPDGEVQCSVTLTSDTGGIANGSCKLPARAPVGPWNAQVSGTSKTGYNFDTKGSVLHYNFSVQ